MSAHDDGHFNPYAAPGAEMSGAPPSHRARAPLARRFTRFCARLIDGVLYVLIFAAFALLLQTAGVSWDPERELLPPADARTYTAYGVLLVLGSAVIALQLTLLARGGQTLGKLALGIRIVRADREPASFGRILFLRTLPFDVLGFIPLIGNFIGLVNVVTIFGEERRCLHDHLADTVVVEG